MKRTVAETLLLCLALGRLAEVMDSQEWLSHPHRLC
jgi:hypothetical protein